MDINYYSRGCADAILMSHLIKKKKTGQVLIPGQYCMVEAFFMASLFITGDRLDRGQFIAINRTREALNFEQSDTIVVVFPTIIIVK